MFSFSDPVGTGLIERENALTAYRLEVDRFDKEFGRLTRSAYVVREAFLELAAGAEPHVDGVSWVAFPRTATASNEEIDRDRFDWQDEYVEWRTERNAAGAVTRITFTTEFPEYYQALAAASAEALIRGIREVILDANPTTAELFGPNFNPNTVSSEARSQRFRSRARNNPWNNGQKGILFLNQQFNTMSALFNLAGQCAVARPELDPGDVCGAVDDACGPARNSDPVICRAVQELTRGGRGLSLEDPVGIRFAQLGGIWKINGQQVDINDPLANQGAWTISRNGRRATLEVARGVTMGDDPITSGAQVATALLVRADVISVAEDSLPEWARTGQESFLRNG